MMSDPEISISWVAAWTCWVLAFSAWGGAAYFDSHELLGLSLLLAVIGGTMTVRAYLSLINRKLQVLIVQGRHDLHDPDHHEGSVIPMR